MGFSGTGGHYTLGPTVRVDIDCIDTVLPEVSDTLRHTGCTMLLGLVVSTRPEELIDSVMSDLSENRHLNETLELQACWHAAYVRTGEDYALWFGPGAPEGGNEQFGLHGWETGRIAPITNSATMVDYIREGTLPDINREETLRPLRETNPHFTLNELEVLERVASSAANEIDRDGGIGMPRTAGRRYDAADVREDASLVLAETEGVEMDVLRQDWELLLTVGTWMSTTRLRDLVLASFLENPKPAEHVLLAVAQSFHETARSNSLCLYAAVLIARKFSMRTGLVLATVLEEDPNHSLAKLMMQAYRSGLHDWLVDALTEGSNQAQDSLTTMLDDDDEPDEAGVAA